MLTKTAALGGRLGALTGAAGALYLGGSALAGGLGAGAGEGAVSVAPEVAGAEYPGGAGGAMDMWGSQSSPTDAATVFDGAPAAGKASVWQQMLKNRMASMGGQKPYQSPAQRPQQNFVFPEPVVSTMPKDLNGGY